MPTRNQSAFSTLLNICLGKRSNTKPAPDAVDWPALRVLSARHRVDGLLWQFLQENSNIEAPADLVCELHGAFKLQSIDYLEQLRETIHLSRCFQKTNIDVISLKGCALAHELYQPHPQARHAQDIDLLVAPQNFAKACALLVGDGYERVTPAARMPHSADSMARHLLNAYEYFHPVKQFKVELHHRALHNPYAMPVSFEGLMMRANDLSIGGGRIRCLGSTDLAVYLCCHAAEHAFFRLKWLADIARLFDRMGPDDIDRVLHHAEVLGVERHVLLCLIMLEVHGGREFPILDQVTRRRMRHLTKGATGALLREDNSETRFRFADIPSDMRSLAFKLGLSRNWRARGFNFLVHLSNQGDTSLLKLGVKWQLLYALLGRPLALLRWVRRAISKPEAGST